MKTHKCPLLLLPSGSQAGHCRNRCPGTKLPWKPVSHYPAPPSFPICFFLSPPFPQTQYSANAPPAPTRASGDCPVESQLKLPGAWVLSFSYPKAFTGSWPFLGAAPTPRALQKPVPRPHHALLGLVRRAPGPQALRHSPPLFTSPPWNERHRPPVLLAPGAPQLADRGRAWGPRRRHVLCRPGRSAPSLGEGPWAAEVRSGSVPPVHYPGSAFSFIVLKWKVSFSSAKKIHRQRISFPVICTSWFLRKSSESELRTQKK